MTVDVPEYDVHTYCQVSVSRAYGFVKLRQIKVSRGFFLGLKKVPISTAGSEFSSSLKKTYRRGVI